MLSYYPTLRAKPGEFAACGKLTTRYQQYFCPRFVVPPPTEPDPEKGRVPTLDEIGYWLGERLGKSWPHNRAFIDPQLAATMLGDDGIETLFRMATSVNSRLLPVLSVADLSNPVRQRLLRDGPVRTGIRIDFEELDAAVLLNGLTQAGLRPEECVMFVDFTGAPLGVDFAPNISEIFDRLDGAARWSKIVYQASAYPEKLPVAANARTLIARSEWTTFLAMLKETGVDSDRLAYGDFGADCGRMYFPRSKGGGRPRPHLRYTSEKHTLVVRGSDSGPFTPTMRKVCRQIVDSPEYSGRSYSYADERIWQNAHGMTDTCGDPTAWRELNTAHHLVRVIRDLGNMAGVAFEGDAVGEYSEQGLLM